MKIAAAVVGALLGLFFVTMASMVLFGFPPMPKDMPMPVAGSAEDHFMQAFGPTTGYLQHVKWVELLGGLMVMVPLTRNIGLLFLGPVILNILMFHQLVKGDGVLNPMLIGISVAALFLMWVERKAWAGLVKR